MRKTLLGMSIAAFILCVIAVFQGGITHLTQGVFQGIELLARLLPILIIAFFVAGLISVLISEEMVSKWLGKEAGWKGPLFGALAGALVPGGPFFFYPLMATLIISGAEVGTLMSFVAAKTIWSVGRIPLEVALVGTELTFIRLAITFIFPVVVGILVNTFLPSFTGKIRSDVESLQAHNKKTKGSDDNA